MSSHGRTRPGPRKKTVGLVEGLLGLCVDWRTVGLGVFERPVDATQGRSHSGSRSVSRPLPSRRALRLCE